MLNKIKVFIVDDSASVRKILSEVLDSDPSIKVIAASSDPIIAKGILQNKWPDVFILDIEMPRMNGLTFLKEIMATKPTPVVICSSLTANNTRISMEAMAAGAVEVITKPKIGIKEFFQESAASIIDAVKSACQADLKKLNIGTTQQSSPLQKLSADVILSPFDGKHVKIDTDKIVAIGASAGGTHTIEFILKSLSKESPGIVIVQHMPEQFTNAFAERLNGLSEVTVSEAKEGDLIKSGSVMIAPGNKHLLVERSHSQYKIIIKDGPLVSRHRPSVDVLFRSVAKSAGKNSMGVILTGMGDDGAAGMLEMKKAGAETVAQDQETSVVFGMPREAIKRGGVNKVLPLQKIPEIILNFNKLLE